MAPTVVKLHLYDLSNGMARGMSLAIIGKQLDGIWHSGIVVFDVEYFFGGGICAAAAGRAIPGLPYQEIILGTTTKTKIELESYLQSISHRFTQATYSLLRHNCNNFANEVSQYLLGGVGIPEHIIRLPQEFLSSPMGLTMAPMIEAMEGSMREQMVGGGHGLNPFGNVPRTPIFDAPKDRMLQTALDGIPASILSPALKDQIIAGDAICYPQLVEVMKKHFNPDKTPVLLSFGTIMRSLISVPQFRDEINSTSLLVDILRASFNSPNAHMAPVALGIVGKLEVPISTELLQIVAPGIVKSLNSASSKLSATALANVLRRGDASDPIFLTIESAGIEALVANAITGDKEVIELLMEGVETGAERISVGSLSVEPEKLIAVVEHLEALFPNRSLKSVISLVFQS